MSTNNAPSRVLRVLLAVLMCVGTAACDIGISGISTFGIRCESGLSITHSIAFVPADTVRLRVGTQDSIEVRAADSLGATSTFCSPRMTIVSAAPAVASADAAGYGLVILAVRGIAPGRTVLRASSGGRSDSLAIIVSR